MSIAWGSLVLLILLLPGVLFFVGLYLPEEFTRETAERSALGQLAATLLVAFFIHGVIFALLDGLCGPRLPCISLLDFFRVLALPSGSDDEMRRAAGNFSRFRWWILSYVSVTAALGVLVGYAAGKLAIGGRFRGLTQHGWIYDLSVGDNFTVAYVLTHVREGDRVLMYQGFLKAFGLQKDGRFSYIVLTEAMRGYMHLGATHPQTSATQAWKPIGASSLVLPTTTSSGRQKQRERSYFVIEGEDIANAVFDRLAIAFRPVDLKIGGAEWAKLLAQIVAEHDRAIAKRASETRLGEKSGESHRPPGPTR